MRKIAVSLKMKGELDDDYTLYENGDILHKYDKSRYPGKYDLTEMLTANEISDDVKARLLEEASIEDKELARKLLNLSM